MLKNPDFFNFLAKCIEFWQNFDRTLMWKVRMVRSLADRTFQLRTVPLRRRIGSSIDFIFSLTWHVIPSHSRKASAPSKNSETISLPPEITIGESWYWKISENEDSSFQLKFSTSFFEPWSGFYHWLVGAKDATKPLAKEAARAFSCKQKQWTP